MNHSLAPFAAHLTRLAPMEPGIHLSGLLTRLAGACEQEERTVFVRCALTYTAVAARQDGAREEVNEEREAEDDLREQIAALLGELCEGLVSEADLPAYLLENAARLGT